MTTIITNNQPRFTLDWYDLTDAEKALFAEFDDADIGTYVRYKDGIYNLNGEFMVVPDVMAKHGWDGIHTDTFFSGILFRWVDDSIDEVIMGRYYE
jgi:hypothetical protein